MIMNTQARILIIEDNLELVDMYRVKFEREGFEVDSTLNGEQGILKAVDFKPDIILLDILMPNMDGWQVLSTIRDNTSLQAKIIILSNLGQQELIDKAFQLGASAYLIKANHTPSKVVEKVRDFLQDTTSRNYLLKLAPQSYDYDQFMSTTPDAVKASTCPSCFGDVVLNFVQDKRETDGTWWKARFICSKCGEKF
jgi:DNA-binding response OmpR family regulator